MTAQFMEENNIKANVPADIVAGLTGSTVRIRDGYRLAIVMNMGDSVAATVEASLIQTDGTTPKALVLKNPYHQKVAAATVFTKVDAPNLSTVDLSALADDEGLVVLDILAEDLDRNNGYHSVSLDLAAATVAKIVSVEYIMHDMRFRPASEQAL